MTRLRRYRAPSILIAAFAAILVFAATAAAETRVGESSSPTASGSRVDPESQIVKATGSYDTSTGATSFAITTQAPPQATIEGEYNATGVLIELFTARSGCTIAALESAELAPPLFGIDASYGAGGAAALYIERLATSPESALLGPAEKVVDGTTTTLGFTSSRIANQGFNCALVGVLGLPSELEEKEEAEEKEKKVDTGRVFGSSSFVFFALNALPTPSAPVVNNPPPPAPAPAVLAIAKAKKPLKLKVGKWATVKVKVTNSGGTTSAPGSLQLKAAKGVTVKGGKQKLPVLLPGGSWTVSYKVKLTAKAKKISTLSLVGAAGAVSAKSSLVLKLAGG